MATGRTMFMAVAYAGAIIMIVMIVATVWGPGNLPGLKKEA